jgi:hypothetical protein
MNSTNVCLIENSDTEINNLAQSIFIVLSFCSVISNVVIYSDKLLENNKNFKKINNTYNVLKEYFFNNYKEDKDGNIIIENEPIIPNSVKVENEIKEMINYKSPPVSLKSNKVKKEINDFLNDSDTEDNNKKLEIKNNNKQNNNDDTFKNKNIFKDNNFKDNNFKDNIFKDNNLNDNNLNDKNLNDKNNIQIKHKKKESSNSNKYGDKTEKKKSKDKIKF